MSLKGSGQGVDLGTSTRSLIRSIFFSFLGLEFPYDPLNLLPFLVFLSPRPHTIGTPTPDPDIDDDDDVRELEGGRGVTITRRASAPHHCIIAIFFALKASRFTVVVAQNSKPTMTPPHSENETVGVALWAGLGLSLSYYFFIIDTKGPNSILNQLIKVFFFSFFSK